MEEVKNSIQALLDGLDVDRLLRRSEDLNFLEVESEVQTTVQYLRLLSEYDEFFFELPQSNRQHLTEIVRRAVEYLTTMRAFVINPQVNFQSEWSSIIAQFRDLYPTFYERVVVGLKAHVAMKSAESKDVSGDVKKIKTGLKELQKAAEEVEAIKQNTEIAAGKTSISSFQKAFKEQAKQHKLSADKWLKALLGSSGAVAVLGVVFVILSFNQDFLATDARVIVITFAIKLVVLSAAIYLVRICSKNYSAHKHLQTLNEHRVNVLQSLPAFIDSVNSDNKDLMFTIGAKTAFEAGETGLISVKEGAGSSNDELTRILADMMKR